MVINKKTYRKIPLRLALGINLRYAELKRIYFEREHYEPWN